ncbi:VOC family protein [Arthrobacter sp. H14]|uniref:VOC family protein n=1 Tax=Arthrobacter sp. H14 TaxID=1312959 RepID=UPI00047D7F56|nr:VOC family protein [Arthrobacter sp. H14]
MTSALHFVVVDSRDPVSLARFWCAALGYEVHEEYEEGIRIAPPDGGRPLLDFLFVPEPKVTKNRMHLDLRPTDTDQAGEVVRLESLGARRVNVGQGPEVDWVVLSDPEGNEFCVLAGL